MTSPPAPAFTPAVGTRAGLLAAWYAAFHRGEVAAAEVARQAGRHDAATTTGIGGDLADLVTRLRRDGVEALELLLPIPGDVRGLPATAPFSAETLAAGEGLVTRGSASRSGLTPQLSRHGRDGDRVVICVWTEHPVGVPELLAAPMLSVAEAEGDLKFALLESTRELARLEVARWAPELAGPLEQLREDARRGRGAAADLPPGHPPAARALLARAEPLERVLTLAFATPGMIVTAADERGRESVLRGLASAVRRARMAAYNAVGV